jgi:lipoprotein-anchoring transpeptidase ErfK/SrfK
MVTFHTTKQVLSVSLLALSLTALGFAAEAKPAAKPDTPAQTAAAKAAAAKAAKPAPRPVGPLVAVVSIANQRISVYNRDGRITGSSVSTGQSGFETPQGVFSVIGKEKEHFSNLYNDAPMPNMQRITWSGVALHAGNLPGYPASHGCIRLPYDFSAKLFNLTKMGTRVTSCRSRSRIPACSRLSPPKPTGEKPYRARRPRTSESSTRRAHR